ncbi:hypothetical protein JTB14_014162 [Gonioctena quinquepunctata]|nr:hypothetical protein JTB14_014162 [Gonioctena quinquepunctata]
MAMHTSEETTDTGAELREDENYIWLLHNSDPWTNVENKWDLLYDKRREQKCESAAEFLKLWSVLNDPRGISLIVKDFERLFPSSSMSFYVKWEPFYKSILEYKKNIASEKLLMSLIEKIESTENTSDVKLIKQFFLPRLILPKGRVKLSNKTWKFSAVECQEGFFVHVTRTLDPRETVTNVESDDIPQNEDDTTTQTPTEDVDAASPTNISPGHEHATTPTVTSTRKKTISEKRKKNYEESLLEILRQKKDDRLALPPSVDPDTNFALYLVPMLKAIPMDKRIDAHIGILSILRQYTTSSVTPTSFVADHSANHPSTSSQYGYHNPISINVPDPSTSTYAQHRNLQYTNLSVAAAPNRIHTPEVLSPNNESNDSLQSYISTFTPDPH